MRSCTLLAIVLIATTALADDKPAKIQWSGTASNGAKLQVPATGPSLVVFIRPDQPQSKAAIDQIKAALTHCKDVQIIAFVSADQTTGPAVRAMLPESWPTVFDPEFTASGSFNVHVWPTTVLVKSDGEQAAHLAGISTAFAADLEDYLEYTAGKIDAATLKKRLAEHDVVEDDAAQKAHRLALVAQRLLDAGQIEQAKTELDGALKLLPGDPQLSTMMARVLLLNKQPQEALAILDQLPAGAVAAWQLSQLRGRALIDMNRWEEARGALSEATKLNPHPSEAHYLIALVLQHDGKYQEAASEFREAYESNVSTGK